MEGAQHSKTKQNKKRAQQKETGECKALLYTRDSKRSTPTHYGSPLKRGAHCSAQQKKNTQKKKKVHGIVTHKTNKKDKPEQTHKKIRGRVQGIVADAVHQNTRKWSQLG